MSLYALSNWSAETFPVALKRFAFLKWFRGVIAFWRRETVESRMRGFFQAFFFFLETFASTRR